MKATIFSDVEKFQDIPNIGPAMIRDFHRIGLKEPVDLIGKDAFVLYKKLCKITKTRQDPCVLDTYIAAVDFMNGAPSRPWWFYTEDRKKQYPNI